MTARLEIVVGAKYGRYTVAGPAWIDTAGKQRVYVKCDCGKQKTARISNLISGKQSGCRSCARTKHGGHDTPEYRAWENMIARCKCTNPKRRDYRNYYKRGIRVCQEWQDSFEAFFAHIGPRPSPEHSIDRIDNNGNYEPGNVRWATDSQQRRNQRKREAA